IATSIAFAGESRNHVAGTMHRTSSGESAVGVSIRGVSRIFPGGVEAVRDVSLDITPGEFGALLGPSGCGKATLLRIIAGLDRPTSGTIEVSRDHIGFVFQDAHLLP